LGTLAAWKLVILGGEGGGVALATGILASVVDPYSVVSPPITVIDQGTHWWLVGWSRVG